MVEKTNVIIISFKKWHLFQNRFIKHWKQRFPTKVVHPALADYMVREARKDYDHVTLITDIPHLTALPHDRFVLKGSCIKMDGEPYELYVGMSTRVLSDRVFYEICSWLIEHRFPEKFNLL